MKKKKITFEQLMAGALLKFGKLESTDISLIIKEISNYVEIELDEDDNIDKYLIMGDGSVLLNEKFVHRFYENMHDSLIKMVEGTIIEKYFSNLDMSEFVLKKIKMIGLGFVVKDGIRDIFSKRQIDTMEGLYKRGFVEDYMHEDSIYGDYEAIRVTQKGNVALFYANNRKEVKAFLNVLRNVGYNDKFLSKYLMEQDLDLSSEEILSIDNFTLYCENCANEKENVNNYVRKKINK